MITDIIKTVLLTFVTVSALLTSVSGDVYMHNPRGSNNRCDRRTNDRANANRLFDSQNNAAGGYAVACDRPDGATGQDMINCYKMNYYQGSELQLRWTSQHNCGINNDCQFIIQYSCEGEDMLGSNIRDGHPQNSEGNTCTETIPETLDSNMVNPNKYGKYEDYGNYQQCKNRLRNKRLFTADQKLKGNSAIYTRQNPAGTRYGFECPEERDYYPYWSKSPWIDIAVLTNNPDRCAYYNKESQCVSPKFECVGISQSVRDSNNVKGIPNTEAECDNLGGHWIKFDSFNSLDNVPNCNFTCVGTPPSSAINRLGESISFEEYLDNNTQPPPKTHQAFTWVLPTFKDDLRNCVLRIRYNISTYETPWNFTIDDNNRLKNNPVMNTSNGVPVRMAIDTSQYGRIFEDRSYTFNIIKRPLGLMNKNIHNINVQGKRGNIAQIRNCIEYDFVPNNITITDDDYLHFQWVGSDYNPIGNDGEGRDGTDRSNLVVLNSIRDNIPYQGIDGVNLDAFDVDNNFILASIRQDILNPDKCFTWQELTTGNQRNNKQSHKNCALLNSAIPYFNMEPIKVIKGVKKSVMMCSRNNNFSNRGQKLIITIKALSDFSTYDNIGNDANTSPNKDNIQKKDSSYSALIAYCIIGVLGFVFILLAIVARRNYLKRIERYRQAGQENTNPDDTESRALQIGTLQRTYRNIKRTFQSKI